jgi:thioredoxin-dependent peroxiredoxin
MTKIKEGNSAPAFSLEDQNGTKRSLKEFTEDYIILFFYPRDNTPGCTLEAQGFTKLKKMFDQISALPLGISGGDLKSKQKFCQKAKLDITLLSDEDNTVGIKYEAFGEKKFMGKIHNGYHRKTFVLGPDRKIIKIYDSVKPANHPEEVLDYLKELT